MTREERRQRRARIARDLMESDDPVHVIAAKYGVSVWQIRVAAREHGIALPRRPRSDSRSSFRIVAMLQEGDKSLSDIARLMGTSRQYISLVRNYARRAGIKGV